MKKTIIFIALAVSGALMPLRAQHADTSANVDINLKANVESLAQFRDTLHWFVDTLMDVLSSEVSSDDFSAIRNAITKSQKKKGYSNRKRTDLDFLWGWNNWGDKPYNGLMGMDGAYDLTTSFSSYQLGFNYAVVMTPHWQVKLGLNYESDIYKFRTDYVEFGTNELVAGTAPMTGTWHSRLVARYVSLPVTLGYRSNDKARHFRVDIAAVPGLCFNGKHTGLKYEMERTGADYKEVTSAARYLNPVKLDVRFDISYMNLKFFIQVPTLPVFVDEFVQDCYPIKIGFMI